MAWRHENIGRSLHDWLQQNASGALYIRLQSSLEAAIREGALKPGSKLPPERKLAKQLNVSRTTVTTAYRELEAKGLVRGFVGRGTYVCGALESTDVPFSWHGKMSVASLRLSNERVALNCDSVNPGLISFERGSPALECFPVEEYRRIEQPIVSRRSSDALGVGPITGQPALRNAIAKEHSVKAEEKKTPKKKVNT